MTKLMLSAAAALALAAPARAAGHEMPALFGAFKPKVGAWAEYSFEKEGGKAGREKGTFRVSVVGKEGDDFWVEMKFKQEEPKPKHEDEAAVMKMLVGTDPSKPRRMLMKTSRGVMELPSRPPKEAAAGKKPKEVGSESVKVPAGSFETKVLEYKSDKDAGKVWVKEGVGPWGVIKQEGKGSHVALLSYGGDAKAEVDETQAMKMPSPMGMMGPGSAPGAAPSGMAPGMAPGGMNEMIRNAMKMRQQRQEQQKQQGGE